MKIYVDKIVELKDNAMLNHRPELILEWDFEKNDELGLNIYEVAQYSRAVAWWICPTCDMNYKNKITNRAGKYNCPYCSGRRTRPYESIVYTHPQEILEWNRELNKNIKPTEFSFGSDRKVWWTCSKCDSNYYMKIEERVNKCRSCPYCSGKKVNHTNSLASLNPELASEWHPTLNGDLTADKVVCSSNKKVWWLGARCKHKWNATVNSRSSGTGCPYCSSPPRLLLLGFNDMWTTNPELAKQLLNPEDGYRYMQSSNKKVDWKCRGCSISMNTIAPNNFKRKNMYCASCSDGTSYGERVVFNILTQLDMVFDYDRTQSWSNKKRYDFYLPEYNLIIETHGGQHYEESSRGRTLEEEQANDNYKYEMAMNNGVEKYVVIDTREDDFEYVKNNIEKSIIKEVLDMGNLDWNKVKRDSLISLVIKSAELWNGGMKSAPRIGENLKISRSTARRYLIKASKSGLCDYDPFQVREETIRNLNKRREEKRIYGYSG